MKQGHYHKARAIIGQILEVGPKSHLALETLERIDKIIAAERRESCKVENEGRESLMAAFDKSMGPKNRVPNGSSSLITEVNLVLDDYLKEIKDKGRIYNL